jgi:aspartyl-tRNA(Asn)/glutamyl-tRNA(Gln) amidotransferase subunit A
MSGCADVAALTLSDAARLISSRKLSPVELTEACLDRVRRFDPAISSFILVTEDAAIAQAKQAGEEIANGRYRGPLHGIPYALKDIIETAGIPTTAHSRVLRHHVPEHDAVVVRHLRAAGGILFGKLACLEFAHARPTPDQAWPQARNPWNSAHGFTGGSSTGSAAAVAASFALGTIGTDTGGSIRNPAALCGITGLMPTYGRVSRRGVIPYSYSLDHVGPLAWTAEDCAAVLQAIAGHDPEDPGSAEKPVPDFKAEFRDRLAGVRIGWIRHFYERDMIADEETRKAIEESARALRDLGATVEETSAQPLQAYHDCKLIISTAEFYSVHEAEFAAKFADYGDDLKSKVFPGAFIRAIDYLTAQKQRRKLARDMLRTMARFDVLLTAANFRPAPRIADTPRDSGEFFQTPNITAVSNIAGAPTISLCNGFSANGLPLAFQLIGRPFGEATLLAVAHAYQQATSWHRRRPNLLEPLAARARRTGA